VIVIVIANAEQFQNFRDDLSLIVKAFFTFLLFLSRFIFLTFFLASSANLPTGLYILLPLISFFLIGTQLSQDLLDRFSQSLHRMVGIELQIINPIFFFRHLNERCHGNQF